MQAPRTRLVFSSACALGFFLVYFLIFPVRVVWADCTVSKIAVIAGSWTNTDTKTSYTVQAQDSGGTACNVTNGPLRLSLASSGAGTFTNQTGDVLQAPINMNTGTANRNFYYQHAAGATGVLTIQAGYGAPGSWSVSFETSYDTAMPASVGETDKGLGTTSTSVGTTAGTRGGASVTSASKTGEAKSSTAARPRVFQDDPLKLVLSHQKRASVGQPVPFVATPSGLEPSALLTLRYSWNFGDGTTAAERMPSHVYTHPGAYVVMGGASRQGHEIVIRTEVTILPLQVTLDRDADGALVIENAAQNEIEISAFSVSDGTHRFAIPDFTYLLPKASVALPPARTGFASDWSTAFLYNREGILLAQYPTIPESPESTETADAEEDAESASAASSTVPFVFAEASSAEEAVAEEEGNADESVIAGDIAMTEAQSQETQPQEEQEEEQQVQHQTQLAALSGSQTRADDGSRRVAPYAFVGVLLMGIVALYVHKIV